MTHLLIKLFPVLWPFILEFFTGGKGHPHDFPNDEKGSSILVPILTLVVTISGVVISHLITENAKLEQELKVALKPSDRLQELSVDLYVCKRANADLEKHASSLIDERKRLDMEYMEKLHTVRAECAIKSGVPVVIQVETLSDKALKRLEALKSKETPK